MNISKKLRFGAYSPKSKFQAQFGNATEYIFKQKNSELIIVASYKINKKYETS